MKISISKLLDIGSSLALIVASVVLVMSVTGKRRATASSPPPVQRSAVANIDVREDGSILTTGAGLGAPEARIVMIEFTDFQCPYCGRFARDTFPEVSRKLIDTGRVRYVVHHLPIEKIHPFAVASANAVECADREGKYWELREKIFNNQDKLTDEDLLRHAESIGLDKRAFRDCMGSGVAPEIKADLAIAERLAVRGTPAFFVGTIEEDGSVRLLGRINGSQPFAAYESAVSALAAKEQVAAR